MFEQGLAYFLKQFLGEFVEDSSILQEKIQIGVWSGYVVLEQLVLKRELLAVLNLPISLSYGVIGRFELRIPWGNLGVEPVVVVIDRLHLVLEPKYEWDPTARDNREQTVKQAKLAAVELFASKRPNDDPLQGYRTFVQKWLMQSVVSKLVDNIQVTVRDLHIRYEDHLSCPSNFCVGFSFESLHAHSRGQTTGDEAEDDETSTKNQPKSKSNNNSSNDSHNNNSNNAKLDGTTVFEKIVQLSHMAVYWNPLVHSSVDACLSTFIGRGPVEVETLMQRTIARRNHQLVDRPHHHYILMPVDMTCNLGIALNPDNISDVKVNVKLSMDELSIFFEDNQFREIISFATNMSNFSKLEEFSSYRPKVSVKENPAAWWRYAINAVRFQMQKLSERKSLTLKQLLERKNDKLVYIELWKRKLHTSPSILSAVATPFAKIVATAASITNIKNKDKGTVGSSSSSSIGSPKSRGTSGNGVTIGSSSSATESCRSSGSSSSTTGSINSTSGLSEQKKESSHDDSSQQQHQDGSTDDGTEGECPYNNYEYSPSSAENRFAYRDTAKYQELLVMSLARRNIFTSPVVQAKVVLTAPSPPTVVEDGTDNSEPSITATATTITASATPMYAASSDSQRKSTLGRSYYSRKRTVITGKEPIKSLTAETARLLRLLERILPFDAIIYFRSLAEKELSVLNAENGGGSGTQQTWLGGLLSWASGSASQGEGGDAERSKFLAVLQENPENVFSPPSGRAPVSPDAVHSTISVMLGKGSVTLALSTPNVPHHSSVQHASSSVNSLPFLEVGLQGLLLGTTLYGDGSHVEIKMSLQDIEAFEVTPAPVSVTRSLSVGSLGTSVSGRSVSHNVLQSLGGGTSRLHLGGSSSTASVAPETHCHVTGGAVNVGGTGTETFGAAASDVRFGYKYTKLISRRYDKAGRQRPATPTPGSTSPHFGIGRSHSSNTRISSENLKASQSAEARTSRYWTAKPPVTVEAEGPRPPLLSVDVELTPGNKDREGVLCFSLEELEILLSPSAQWVGAITAFFAWPADLEFWSEMEMKALNQFVDFKSRIDAKLEYMMTNHSNFALEARISAPVVIVSDGGADMLVIDLGFVQFRTEKLAKAEYEKGMKESEVVSRSSAGLSKVSDTLIDLDREFGHDTLDSPQFSPKRYQSEKQPGNEDTRGESVSFNKSEKNNNESTKWQSSKDDRYDDIDDHQAPQEAPLRSAAMAAEEEADHDNDHDLDDGTNAEEEFEALFDVFQLHVSYIEVFMMSAADWTGHIEDGCSGKMNLVEKFDISVEIQLCVLPWDATLPTAKLFVDIPEINTKLSEEKIVHLAKFAAGLASSSGGILEAHRETIAKLEQAKSRSKADQSLVAAARNQRASFMALSPIVSERKQVVTENTPVMESWKTPAEFESAKQFPSSSGITAAQITSTRRLSALSTRQRSGRSSWSWTSPVEYGDCRENSSNGNPTGSTKTIQRRASVRNSISRSNSLTNNEAADDDFEMQDARSEASDDSFLSAEEDPRVKAEEAAVRVSELQHAIRQRESMRTRLMSDIRLLEATKPTKKVLVRALQEELLACEGDLHQLKIAFVEALMVVDEVKITAARDLNTLAGREGALAMDKETAGMREFFDSLVRPTSLEAESMLDERRMFMRDSVFKSKPEKPSGGLDAAIHSHMHAVGGDNGNGNKELVVVHVNISQITLILSKTVIENVESTVNGGAAIHRSTNEGSFTNTDHTGALFIDEIDESTSIHSRNSGQDGLPSSHSTDRRNNPAVSVPPQLMTLLSFRLSGMSLRANHRAFDSTVSLTIRDLDIEDALATRIAALNVGIGMLAAPVYLITSEPSASGLSNVSSGQERYMANASSSNLLKLKYEVIYGREVVVNNNDHDEEGNEVKDSDNNVAGSSSASKKRHVGDMEEESDEDSHVETVKLPSKHKFKTAFGYLGVNIEQETVAALLSIAHAVSSAVQSVQAQNRQGELPSMVDSPIPGSSFRPVNSSRPTMSNDPLHDSHRKSPSTVVDDDTIHHPITGEGRAGTTAAATTTAITTPQCAFPNLKLAAKWSGLSVALLHRGRPLVSMGAWALVTSVQSLYNGGALMIVKLADVSVHHHVDAAAVDSTGTPLLASINSRQGSATGAPSDHGTVGGTTTLFPRSGSKVSNAASNDTRDTPIGGTGAVNSMALRHLVFGRKTDCTSPSLSFSLMMDTTEGGRPRANAKLTVAPMQVVLVPSFLSVVTASLAEGAIATQLRALSVDSNPASNIASRVPSPSPLEMPPNAFDEASSSSSLTPLTLDNICGPIFANSCGCFTLISGPFTVTAPCEYDDAAASFWPDFPQQDLSSLDLSVSVGRGMNIKTAWGSLCAFQGADSAVAVYGIDVKASGRCIVDPFDVCAQLMVSPSEKLRARVLGEAIITEIGTPDVEMSTESPHRVERLQIDHPFWPYDTSSQHGDDVRSNSVEASIAASPIHLHISESLLRALSHWQRANDRSFQMMHSSLSVSALSEPQQQDVDLAGRTTTADNGMHPPDRVNISPIATTSSTGPPLALGFKLKFSALFHEVAVQLDGREDSPSGQRDWRTGVSRTSFASWASESISRSSPVSWREGFGSTTQHQPRIPLFVFSMRHIDVSLVAGSVSQESRDSLIPFAGSGVCLSCAITSVDFEHIRAAGLLNHPDGDTSVANSTRLRRILATVQPTAQDIAVASAASSGMAFGDEEYRSKNNPAIFARIELTNDWDLVVHSSLTGLQLAMCPISIEELLSVVNDFSTAFATTNDRIGVSPPIRQASDKSSMHSLGGSNRRILPPSQRICFAQPASFPIALMQKQTGLRVDGNAHNETVNSVNETGGKSSSNQGKESADSLFASPPVVLRRAAFALPNPLRSLQICTAVKSCGFWFLTSEVSPVDKRNTQVPRNSSTHHAAGGGYGMAHSSAMHASLDLTTSLAVDALDWRGIRGALMSKSQILAAEMVLVSYQVSLSRFKYPELFTPLDPVCTPPPLQQRRQMPANNSASPSAQSKGQRQPFSNVTSPHDSSDVNDDGRQYGFFQQCEGDNEGVGANVNEVQLHPNTSSSQQEAAASGSSPSSYQQQGLLSPLRGKLSYVLFLSPGMEDNTRNGLLLEDGDDRGWVVEQQLDGRIEEVEVIVHLDMRPIQRTIYDCIVPIIALASKNCGKEVIEMEPSEQHVAAPPVASVISEPHVIAPQSILALLGTLSSISELSANLTVEGVSLYLVNDFYRQPATVARTICHSITMSASIVPCLRMKSVNNHDIEDREHQSDPHNSLHKSGPGLMRSHDQKHSSASLQSIRSTTNSPSVDDIATSPLLRIVQSLNLPSAAVHAVMQPPSVIMSKSRAASPSVLSGGNIIDTGPTTSTSLPTGSGTANATTDTTTTLLTRRNRFELKVSPSVEYYNQTLMAWEPLVEPFEAHFSLIMPQSSTSSSQLHGPLHWRIAKNRYPSSALSFPVVSTAQKVPSTSNNNHATPLAPMSLRLDLPKAVNVNLTMALLHVASANLQSLSRHATAGRGDKGTVPTSSDIQPQKRVVGLGVELSSSVDDATLPGTSHTGGGDDNTGTGADLSVMAIRNDTGLMLRYWTRDPASACAMGPDGERSIPLADLTGSDKEGPTTRHNLRGHSKRNAAISSSEPTDGGSTGTSTLLSPKKTISLSLQCPGEDPFPPLMNVPLEGAGCRVFVIEVQDAIKSSSSDGRALLSGRNKSFCSASCDSSPAKHHNPNHLIASPTAGVSGFFHPASQLAGPAGITMDDTGLTVAQRKTTLPPQPTQATRSTSLPTSSIPASSSSSALHSRVVKTGRVVSDPALMMKSLSKAGSLCVAAELASHGGFRTLSLRSTMRFVNETNVPVRLVLLSAPHNSYSSGAFSPDSKSSVAPSSSSTTHRPRHSLHDNRDILWEVIVSGHGGRVPVPAHLCHVHGSVLRVQPMHCAVSMGSVSVGSLNACENHSSSMQPSQSLVQLSIAEVEVPSIPGLIDTAAVSSSKEQQQAADSAASLDHGDDAVAASGDADVIYDMSSSSFHGADVPGESVSGAEDEATSSSRSPTLPPNPSLELRNALKHRLARRQISPVPWGYAGNANDVEELTYSQWLSFAPVSQAAHTASSSGNENTESIVNHDMQHYNLDVVCKGPPPSCRSSSGGVAGGTSGGAGARIDSGALSAPEACMSRVLTLVSPVRIENLLACDVEVLVVPCRQESTMVAQTLATTLLNGGTPLSFVQSHPGAQLMVLQTGESKALVSVHAAEQLAICTRLLTPHTGSELWSSLVIVSGCKSLVAKPRGDGGQSRDNKASQHLHVPFPNGSTLVVQLEVSESSSGARVCSLYVPYWVVSSSCLNVQYQHDAAFSRHGNNTNNASSSSSSIPTATVFGLTPSGQLAELCANGRDGLAADQPYSPQPMLPPAKSGGRMSLFDMFTRRTSSISAVHPTRLLRPGSNGKEIRPKARGVGRARGIGGIVLGPEVAVRGLADMLGPIGSSAVFGQLQYQWSLRTSQRQLTQPLILSSMRNSEGNRGSLMYRLPTRMSLPRINVNQFQREDADRGPADGQGLAHDDPSITVPYFRVMQCGYTNAETDSASLRLRLRAAGTLWSSPFSPDAVGAVTNAEVKSVPGYVETVEDVSSFHVMGPPRSGLQVFSFGVLTVAADPPFQRTKLVIVVDRFMLVNCVQQAIEIRQAGTDDIVCVDTDAETPMWWRPGAQLLQMRLAVKGWCWSGRFSPRKEGEIILRLRNEHDDTVCFVAVRVVAEGPRLCVVFRAGDNLIAPYRIENHTLETFRLRQCTSTPSDRSSSSIFSMLGLTVGSGSGGNSNDPRSGSGVRVSTSTGSLTGGPSSGVTPITTGSIMVHGSTSGAVSSSSASSSQFTLILPYHAAHYAWDDPLALKVFALEISRRGDTRRQSTGQSSGGFLGGDWRSMGRFSFDHLRTLQPLKGGGAMGGVGDWSHLVLKVVAMGPVRVLQIFDSRMAYLSSPTLKATMDQLNREAKLAAGTASGSANGIKASDGPSAIGPIPPSTSLQLQFYAASIGVSVIDHKPQELLFLSIADVDMGVCMLGGDRHGHTLDVQVGRVQLDSQLWSTPYPSLLFPLLPDRDNFPDNRTIDHDDIIDSTAHSSYDKTGLHRRPRQQNFFTMSLEQDFSYPGVVFIPRLQLTIAPFDVNIEGTILARLIGMVYASGEVLADSRSLLGLPGEDLTYHTGNDSMDRGIGNGNGSSSRRGRRQPISSAVDVSIMLRKMLFKAAPLQRQKLSQPRVMVYLQKFELSEIRFNVSFNPMIVREGRQGGPAARSHDSRSQSLMRSAISKLLMAIGSTIAKIENCPLRFRPYHLSHSFLSIPDLCYQMIAQYATQAVSQAYLMLGSSDALGNPVKLIRTLGEGLWDFMYLPAIGLITSPEAFGMGLLRGTSSLLRRTVASLCVWCSNVSGSLQVGLVTLGVVDPSVRSLLLSMQSTGGASTERNGQGLPVMTPEQTTLVMQRSRPKGGFNGLRLGVLGLWSEPLAGLKTDGLRGLFVGLCRGCLGLWAKPLYGLLAVYAAAMDGLSYKLLPRIEGEKKHRMRRARPPRFFRSPLLPLTVYRAEEHVGQELLARVNMGRYRSEGYVWHGRVTDGIPLTRNGTNGGLGGNAQGGTGMVILTSERLLMVGDMHFDYCEVHWQCLTVQMQSLEVDVGYYGYSYGYGITTTSAPIKVHPEAAAALVSDSRRDDVNSSLPEEQRMKVRNMTGAPVMRVHHLQPPSLPMASNVANTRKSSLLRSSFSFKSGGSSSSGSSVITTSPPLQHRTIFFTNHLQAVELLAHLLRADPSLASDSVLHYLAYCGVTLRGIHNELLITSSTQPPPGIHVDAINGVNAENDAGLRTSTTAEKDNHEAMGVSGTPTALSFSADDINMTMSSNTTDMPSIMRPTTRTSSSMMPLSMEAIESTIAMSDTNSTTASTASPMTIASAKTVTSSFIARIDYKTGQMSLEKTGQQQSPKK